MRPHAEVRRYGSADRTYKPILAGLRNLDYVIALLDVHRRLLHDFRDIRRISVVIVYRALDIPARCAALA